MSRASLAGAVLASLCLAGCGDPMLPSDFAGPPAGAVTGNVLQGAPAGEAGRPFMSLEWLAGLGPFEPGVRSLIGQTLRYQRSSRLQSDWDIGLSLPAEAVKFDFDIATRKVRLGVGKVVYFDDRVADGTMDWTCRALECDRVKAVSAEFVVYVESPPFCEETRGISPRPRLSSGYHYFSFDGRVLRERDASEPLSFTLADQTPGDGDPTKDLQAFASYLLWSWAVSALDGC